MTDFYTRLGLQPDANDDDIRYAFRTAIRSAHPDAGGSSDEAGLINEAYDTLSDPVKRRSYDRDHSLGEFAEEPNSGFEEPQTSDFKPPVDTLEQEEIWEPTHLLTTPVPPKRKAKPLEWWALGIALTLALSSATVALLIDIQTAPVSIAFSAAGLLFISRKTIRVWQIPVPQYVWAVAVLGGMAVLSYQEGYAVSAAITAVAAGTGYISMLGVAVVVRRQFDRRRQHRLAHNWVDFAERNLGTGTTPNTFGWVDEAELETGAARAWMLGTDVENSEQFSAQVWGQPTPGSVIALSPQDKIVDAIDGKAFNAWVTLLT
ncbi:DnaJ domain-containing protein [Lysinibacter cavernae]|uniref:DnaJ domain-containing protein n=1 Tax=Lysinibacter cavernae TaxID=1640652 RepID=UPI0036224801